MSTIRERNLPPCKQHRRACLAYSGGKCSILHDTDFGEKKCPFYKTKAMAAAQLPARKEAKQ